MKRKEKETLRNMGDAELKAQALDLKKKIFQINFKRTTAPTENPLVLRTARRKIAMINTWLRQKELAKSKTAEVKK